MSRYCREDVLRILRLPVRQLIAWERAGLIAANENYSIRDLAQLRKLRDLAALRISVKSIRRSVDAMQKVSGMSDPLLHSVASRSGEKLKFRQYGALVDPVTRQMSFDFELSPSSGMSVVRAPAVQTTMWLANQTQDMFQRAVRLEETVDGLAEAKDLYQSILQMHAGHAPAAINLGTIRYNERDYAGAEAMYRRATEADPEYALAFFDLGNVLDEQQRLNEAITAYERALELVPQYADAHYNLALAYERLQEPRRALRHWTAYTQLDSSGPWSNHAKNQAKKILGAERARDRLPPWPHAQNCWLIAGTNPWSPTYFLQQRLPATEPTFDEAASFLPFAFSLLAGSPRHSRALSRRLVGAASVPPCRRCGGWRS